MPSFDSSKDNYAALWASMEVRESKAADIAATANKVVNNKGRYQAVQDVTGVPWFITGTIHQLECGGNFSEHLHNGDSLQRRTTHVPAGRPVAGSPPFTWVASACDAVTFDGLDKVADWSIERILYQLEAYNGWGYATHHPEVNTPYLWSGTNHYSRGKYVADGQWSSDAVSGQSGAAPILKKVMELDSTVCPALSSQTPPPTTMEEKVTDPSMAFPKAVVSSDDAHAAAHETLKATSWIYYLQGKVANTLGLGTVGGGGVFAALQADPIAGIGSLASFAKQNGLLMLGGAILAIAVLLGINCYMREQHIAGNR